MQTQHTVFLNEDLDLLSVGGAAIMLGVSPDTVRRYERAGRIKCRRTPSGHRRFRRVDVEKLRDETNEIDEATS